jgi:hypothetical protein
MTDEYFILKDRNTAAVAIRHLGEEDLHFLNRLIVERLKLIAQAQSTALTSRFNIGDRVNKRFWVSTYLNCDFTGLLLLARPEVHR